MVSLGIISTSAKRFTYGTINYVAEKYALLIKKGLEYIKKQAWAEQDHTQVGTGFCWDCGWGQVGIGLGIGWGWLGVGVGLGLALGWVVF